ncbi:hypothetical protein [Tardiphaga robiniae]|uniref:Uncharacterized protein n=1 Tax=Tardiphaga robiniae TaxID=943830 RepID=A0A7G6TSQ4_9BRAD|nr:hypothetical protein [Tardiphaga robiniae]QND69786.1 hypothetical protein HB776_05510 [Tardiphaga robiniae]
MSTASQIEVDAYDAACSAVIAQCGGDPRGAVKALLCANELLEADLEKALRAASAGYRRRGSVKRCQEGAIG